MVHPATKGRFEAGWGHERVAPDDYISVEGS